MVGQTAPRTTADNERLDIITEIGCLPCLLNGWSESATVQHVTEGGRRLGHQSTYGGCPYHHLGNRPDGYSGPMNESFEEWYGPSFARNKQAFISRYGPERLLIQVTDALVRIVQSARRRGEYLPNYEIQKLAVQIHTELGGPTQSEFCRA